MMARLLAAPGAEDVLLPAVANAIRQEMAQGPARSRLQITDEQARCALSCVRHSTPGVLRRIAAACAGPVVSMPISFPHLSPLASQITISEPRRDPPPQTQVLVLVKRYVQENRVMYDEETQNIYKV